VSEKEITTLTKARLVAYAAQNKKALNPVILNLKDLSSFADFFVIVSGATDVQVYAIYQEIERVCREEKIPIFHTEGSQGSKWILLDLGDVLVHIFRQTERDYYNLEELWSKAKRVNLPEL
jgi:ribosome-associated protein